MNLLKDRDKKVDRCSIPKVWLVETPQYSCLGYLSPDNCFFPRSSRVENSSYSNLYSEGGNIKEHAYGQKGITAGTRNR